MSITNLDYLCIKYGQEIGLTGNKTNIQKSLGVLQEDGVYAMFLWLEDKDGKKVRDDIIKLLNEKEIKKFFLSDSLDFPDDFEKFCNKLEVVAQDIDKLIFLKKILERTLIYALYHAKIKGEEDVEKT